MQEIGTARGSLYPFGKPQERSLNFVPLLARYGPLLRDEMLAGARDHAKRLLGEPKSSRSLEEAGTARGRYVTGGDAPDEKNRSLPEFLPPEADEVTEAAPPIERVERRAVPRTTSRAFDRSKGAALLVGSGILLSRLAGLIRQTMMARYLGADLAADAFNAAFRIPNMLQNLFGEGVLSASFIPRVRRPPRKRRRRRSDAPRRRRRRNAGAGRVDHRSARHSRRAVARRHHRQRLHGREARADRQADPNPLSWRGTSRLLGVVPRDPQQPPPILHVVHGAGDLEPGDGGHADLLPQGTYPGRAGDLPCVRLRVWQRAPVRGATSAGRQACARREAATDHCVPERPHGLQELRTGVRGKRRRPTQCVR